MIGLSQTKKRKGRRKDLIRKKLLGSLRFFPNFRYEAQPKMFKLIYFSSHLN